MKKLLLLSFTIFCLACNGQDCRDCISNITDANPAYTVSNKIVKSLGTNEWHVTVTNHCQHERRFTLRGKYSDGEIDSSSATDIKPGKSYTFNYYREIAGIYIYDYRLYDDSNKNCKAFNEVNSNKQVDKWNYHDF